MSSPSVSPCRSTIVECEKTIAIRSPPAEALISRVGGNFLKICSDK